MIIDDDIKQNTPEWEIAKLGKPSASVFEKIYTSTGKISGQREKLIQQLAREKILGKKEKGYYGGAMQRGHQLEDEARAFFAMLNDVDVEQVGLCYFDERKDRSCSPDGLMKAEKEGLEIKCPELAAHYEYLKAGILPTKYFVQCQGNLYITGFNKWHFFSYHPGMKPLHIEIERDEIWIAKLSKALDDFVVELDETYDEMHRVLIEDNI
ncbi:YqaJ viral recombinase family protein [Candidatus Pacearchaeota archaeon]|nr:YqaJ viral recombinase family protein [Candidatus Pacearchaeota archaeon]